MGFLWDLFQQSELSDHDAAIQKQKRRTASLEDRLEALEQELTETRQLLHTLIQRLETKFGEDIDRDGRVG